jgi:hypothetical protein
MTHRANGLRKNTQLVCIGAQELARSRFECRYTGDSDQPANGIVVA